MNQNMKTKLPILLVAILSTFLAFGCGGDNDTGTTGSPADTGATSSSTQASGEAREIVIEGNDQMQFDITSFDVAPGERIHLVMKNVGTMPKFSMGHNVVVLEQGVDIDAFAEAAMNAAANDYIPTDAGDEIITFTPLTGGGEEASVTFTAPEQTGAYEYLCTFPGHYQLGMRGTMNVR